MLLAKINPSASVVKQDNPFAQPQTIFADYLMAIARPYIAGSSITNFEVQFGNYSEAVEGGQPSNFEPLTGTQVQLTSDELSSWGTDDSVLLSIIATKLKTSVVSTVVVDIKNW